MNMGFANTFRMSNKLPPGASMSKANNKMMTQSVEIAPKMTSEMYRPSQYAGNDTPEMRIWFFKFSSFSLTILPIIGMDVRIYAIPIPNTT